MADSWETRIERVVKEFGKGKQSRVADDLKLKNRQNVSQWVKGRAKPEADALAAMLLAYPELNPDYLLTGEGPLRRDYRPPATPTEAQQAIDDVVNALVRRGIIPSGTAAKTPTLPLGPVAEDGERKKGRKKASGEEE